MRDISAVRLRVTRRLWELSTLRWTWFILWHHCSSLRLTRTPNSEIDTIYVWDRRGSFAPNWNTLWAFYSEIDNNLTWERSVRVCAWLERSASFLLRPRRLCWSQFVFSLTNSNPFPLTLAPFNPFNSSHSRSFQPIQFLSLSLLSDVWRECESFAPVGTIWKLACPLNHCRRERAFLPPWYVLLSLSVSLHLFLCSCLCLFLSLPLSLCLSLFICFSVLVSVCFSSSVLIEFESKMGIGERCLLIFCCRLLEFCFKRSSR